MPTTWCGRVWIAQAAERQARIEFGAREKFKEESYAALGGNLFTGLGRRYAACPKSVCASRMGLRFAAIVTLALAIGANAVVFGVMDALVLHSIDVPNADSLFGTQYGADTGFQSYPNYADLRDRNHSFQDLAAFNFTLGTAIDSGNDPRAASGFSTTGNYFTVLDVHPYLGRLYSTAEEHGPGSAPYLVLSYGYWHSRFQDDRAIIGRIVRVNKHPFTVIGVTPPEFRGTIMFVSPDFFIPVVEQEVIGGNSITDRANTAALFETFGHLKPGVTPKLAEADVNRVAQELAKAYPREFEGKHMVVGRTGLSAFGGAVHGFVAALMALAGMILLAACANLGGLFAAHASDRAKEVALRLALGSTRRGILRQLMIEAMLLALGGGTLGVIGGMPLLQRLSTWHPFAGAPIHVPVTMDARIYAAALALALLSGLLFGLVPVRQVMQVHPYEVVKAGTTAKAGRKFTARDLLLVVQIAICALLVTASLVAVRGLLRSMYASFGFDPRNVMAAGVNLANVGYSGHQIQQFDRRMIDAMTAIPGVEAVGLVNNYPPLVYTAAFREKVFTEQTRDRTTSNVALRPFRFNVSPGYLKAAGTPLLAGRDFTWHDDKSASVPALANRQFVLRMFGSTNGAMGKHFRIGDGTLVEIVGIVEDGKYMALTEDQEPAILMPSMLDDDPQSYLIVRSKRDPEQLQRLIRAKHPPVGCGTTGGHPELESVARSGAVPGARSDHGARGAGHDGRHPLDHRHLRHGGLLGEQAAEGTGHSHGAWRAARGSAERRAGTRGEVAGMRLGGRLAAWHSGQPGARRRSSTRPRRAIRSCSAGVVFAMALLGLLATWIPAQRALSVNPMMLLREE